MTDMEIVSEAVVFLPHGHSRIVCPACSPDRKKKNERTLSVDVDDDCAIWLCHHCLLSGRTNIPQTKPYVDEMGGRQTPSTEVPYSQPDDDPVSELTDGQIEWLATRSITLETAIAGGLVSGEKYISARGKSVDCIGFPYLNADGSTATKWRDGAKHFIQTGSAQSLWRIENFNGGDLVITEGEMDALAFLESGIFSVSVPNGAPSGEVKNISAKKFSYLWDAKDQIEMADRVILCTDKDEPGLALANEIARRVGKARCWRVPIPDGCKDANDILIHHGKDGLIKAIEAATPWPIGGLRDVSEYKEDAINLFRGGFEQGVGCGLNSVDNIFRTLPHTLTVVTGTPGSGKSTFLTWYSVRLAEEHGYRCAVLSAEISSQVHLIQMASAYQRKPYRGPDKMTEEELLEAIDWIGERFVFIDESDTDIDSVLDRTHAAVLRNGIRMLIVDPYNFLTGSAEDGSVSAINQLLVGLKPFAVEHGIAICLVAHPVKMYAQNGESQIPTGYHVAGSSAFYNTCDAGLSLSRGEEGTSVVTCWKSRFPWIGKVGSASISFREEDGTFYETPFGFEDE